MDYTKINSEVVDGWVAAGWQWGQPISQKEYIQAKQGDFQLVLTPTKPIPSHWYPENLKELKVLGLAAGGGQQMPILCALGANCTVLDYSSKQLEQEKMVAEREGYQIEIIKGDMTKKLPFDDESFDLIIHPVSNCYVEEVQPIWQECYRVLKKNGRLLSGLDNGFNYVVDETQQKIVQALPYNPIKNPSLLLNQDISESGVQFSHTLEEQIRGQLQAGFQLVDLYEDTNGSGFLHEMNIPSFWATYTIK